MSTSVLGPKRETTYTWRYKMCYVIISTNQLPPGFPNLNDFEDAKMFRMDLFTILIEASLPQAPISGLIDNERSTHCLIFTHINWC